MQCDRCATTNHEVNHSDLLSADVCLRCYVSGTDLIGRVDAALTVAPQTRANIARTVGRRPSDRSVARALRRLLVVRLAAQSVDGWRRAITT